MIESTEDDGYCDVADRPLPEPACGLEKPCPTHDVPEPTRFVWFHKELGDNGQVGVGTLRDWADMWEHEQYSGIEGLSRLLLTWDGEDNVQYHLVQVERGEKDPENDMISYRITASHCDDEVTVFIDGRS